MIEIVYKDNDTLIEVRDLIAETTGERITGATVGAVIRDSDGDTVTTVSLPEIEAGFYRGILPDDTALTANGRYTAVITADGGPGRKATWSIPLLVKDR